MEEFEEEEVLETGQIDVDSTIDAEDVPFVNKSELLKSLCASFLEQKWMFADSTISLSLPIHSTLLKRNTNDSHLQAFFKIFSDDIWSLLEVYKL